MLERSPGQIPAIPEFIPVGFIIVPIGSHHGRPTGFDGNKTNLPGYSKGFVFILVDHGGRDARNGIPIDPGFIFIPGKLVIMIDPVSVCQ